MSTPRFLPILLAFCMFSTGASGLVNEYVLATITTYILGNSIEQFSIIIAAMMLMMGLSGFAQNKMSDDNLIYKFMGIEILMALLGGFAPLAIYAAYAYLNDHFLFVHYFFVLSIGFLIGFEIPVVMRIIEQNKIKLKKNLTIVYAMDYVGAFIGAIIWVKFLLVTFPLTEVSFIVAGFNFLVALLTITYFAAQNIVTHKWVTFGALATTAALIVIGFSKNQDLNNLFEQRFYDDPIVHKETSRYQHIVVTEGKKTGDVRLYINGNTQLSSLDEKRYHDFLVHPVMALKDTAKNVLILGGGDGLALRETLKYDIDSVTLVDLDPRMVKLASTNPYLTKLNNNAFSDARIHVEKAGGITTTNTKGIYLSNESASWQENSQRVATVDVFNLDADQFIRNTQNQKWDVVIIDFPDPSSIELSKLYSRRFFKTLRTHLTQDALISIQSTSPYHAKKAFLAIGNTLKASGYNNLPYRQNVPSFGDWGFYLAWPDHKPTSAVRSELQDIASFSVDTSFITTDLMRAAFAFGKGELASEDDCVNTIIQPCLLTEYTKYSWLVN